MLIPALFGRLSSLFKRSVSFANFSVGVSTDSVTRSTSSMLLASCCAASFSLLNAIVLCSIFAIRGAAASDTPSLDALSCNNSISVLLASSASFLRDLINRSDSDISFAFDVPVD